MLGRWSAAARSSNRLVSSSGRLNCAATTWVPTPRRRTSRPLLDELLDGLPHGRPAQAEPFREVGLRVDAVAGAQPAVTDGVLELLGQLEVEGHATAAIQGQVQRHGPRLGLESRDL